MHAHKTPRVGFWFFVAFRLPLPAMTTTQKPHPEPQASQDSQQDQMSLSSLLGRAASPPEHPLSAQTVAATSHPRRGILSILEEALLILEDFEFPGESETIRHHHQHGLSGGFLQARQ
jgi:hypothetical protein